MNVVSDLPLICSDDHKKETTVVLADLLWSWFSATLLGLNIFKCSFTFGDGLTGQLEGAFV